MAEANIMLEEEEERQRGSILDSLGEEIIKIVSPVSLCMLLVVILVSLLNGSSSSSSSSSVTTLATLIYDEQSSDSAWQKFGGALLNALVFVAVVTVVTFVLVCLFYFRCTRFLRWYMNLAAFVVLAYMGGIVAVLLVQALSIPVDCITLAVVLFNFTVVGVISVLGTKMPIVLTQGYLVAIGMLVAYWFTMLPQWTTWVLLVAMALYDVAAVLFPGGPLRMLVELAISRDEEIPALIYEARPVLPRGHPRGRHHHSSPRPPSAAADASSSSANAGVMQRRLWRNTTTTPTPASGSGSASSSLWRLISGHDRPASSSSSSSQGNSDDKQAIENQGLPDEEESTPLVNPHRQLESFESSLTPPTQQQQQLPAVLSGQNQVVQEQDPGRQDSQTLTGESEDEGEHESESAHTQQQQSTLPLLDQTQAQDHDDARNGFLDQEEEEGIGLSSSGAIKLGLGDFIFYSVLVGRAAMYDYMTVYACYLAIIAGLGVTLVLLGIFRKALPALPVSISLGVVFYFLTRLLMEAFVVQISTHLLLF